MLTANLACSVFWERGWSLLWAQIHAELQFLLIASELLYEIVGSRKLHPYLSSLLKRRVLRAYTKLTVFIIVFRVSCNSEGSVFYARACLWIMQWRGTAFGGFCITLVTKPDWEPNMAGAPSVHIPQRLPQSRPSDSKNSVSFCITSSPFVDYSRGSQNKTSSFRSSSWTYLTKARSCEQDWTSVDSSSWILNNPALLIFCITCSLMSSDIWDFRGCTVLFESEIDSAFQHFSHPKQALSLFWDMAELIPPELCEASFSLLFQEIQEMMPPLRQHFLDERNHWHQVAVSSCSILVD